MAHAPFGFSVSIIFLVADQSKVLYAGSGEIIIICLFLLYHLQPAAQQHCVIPAISVPILSVTSEESGFCLNMIYCTVCHKCIYVTHRGEDCRSFFLGQGECPNKLLTEEYIPF